MAVGPLWTFMDAALSKKRTHRSRPIPTRTNTSTAKLGSTVLLLKIIPDVREQLLHDTSKNYAGGNLTQRWNITILIGILTENGHVP